MVTPPTARSRSYRLFTAVVTLAVSLNISVSSATARPIANVPPGEDAVVTTIVDGDTIKVTIAGQPFVVRYIGIDSPEVKQDNATYCYSTEATKANEALVVGQTLRLEKDKSNVDRYGRLLRYAYLGDGRMINEELVKLGGAFAKRYRPDVKYAPRLEAAQLQAQTAKAGLWGACVVTNLHTQALPINQQPTNTTSATNSAGDLPAYTIEKGNRTRVDPEWFPCAKDQIKGNRNSNIYHAPGMRDYAYTFKNVECFNSNADAEAAKYRAAKR